LGGAGGDEAEWMAGWADGEPAHGESEAGVVVDRAAGTRSGWSGGPGTLSAGPVAADETAPSLFDELPRAGARDVSGLGGPAEPPERKPETEAEARGDAPGRD
jgi:hypothetical protein